MTPVAPSPAERERLRAPLDREARQFVGRVVEDVDGDRLERWSGADA
jgi:hypothetical protein